jgi:hypothetical protein
MRLGEIRAQRKGFAISLDRRLESLLALQEIAEFGEDLGEIRPQQASTASPGLLSSFKILPRLK